MGTELQDAIEYLTLPNHQSLRPDVLPYIETVVKAARKYDNPDYEAGAKARYEAYIESLADSLPRPSLDPWSWEGLPPIPKAKFRHDARVTIDAALGITEATNG